MDERLKKALDFSKFRYTMYLEKTRLQEKLKSDLTFSFNGGQFYIDRNFIVFLNLISPEEGKLSTTILDDNLTPIFVEDIKVLQDAVISEYNRILGNYLHDFESLRKKRSTATIVDIKEDDVTT